MSQELSAKLWEYQGEQDEKGSWCQIWQYHEDWVGKITAGGG